MMMRRHLYFYLLIWMTGVNMHARCMQVEAFWYGTSALMMQVLSINNDVGPCKTMSGHIFRPIFYPSCIPETPVDLTLNKSLLFGS